MEKITYDYHSWRANKNENIENNRDRSPATLQLVEKKQEITKPVHLRFKFDCNLKEKFRYHAD